MNASEGPDIVGAIKDLTGGGAHISLDALGNRKTCSDSILCLRKRGRHVQVGLMVGDQTDPQVPMYQVTARELEVLGCLGMQGHRYPEMLEMITSGKLNPRLLVRRTITLEESLDEFERMEQFGSVGVTVIDTY